MIDGKIIGQGRTAEIYQWKDNHVLKLLYPNIPKSDAENEYNRTKIAYNHITKKGIKIPEAVELIEVDRRSGIVFEKVEGITMLDYIFRSPLKIKQLSRDLAKLHTEIHDCRDSNLPTLKDGLKYHIDRTTYLSDEMKKTILEKLSALPDGETIGHGDFHPDNIILSDKGTYVIDWLTARKGLGLADVARTYILLRYGDIPSEISFFMKLSIRLIRRVLYKEYLKEYIRLSNASKKDIFDWIVPVVAARLNEGIPEEEKKKLIKVIKANLEISQ